MNERRFEQKLLQQTLSLLQGKDEPLKSQRVFMLVLYVMGGAILIAAYLLTVRSAINPRLGILLAAIGGNCVAVAAYMGVSLRQWPVLKPHLRADTIEARLRDMET